jgi:hypothetical protein
MAVYRAVWFNVAIIVGGLGVTIGLLGNDAVINAVIAAMVGTWVGVLTFLIQDARSATGCAREAVTAAAAVTAGCYAVTGLFMLLAQWALLVAFLFAVTSPAAARGYFALARRITAWRRRRLNAVTTRLGETSPERLNQRLTSQIPARELTDAELCQAWRASSHALKKQGADLTQQAQLVATRQEYLDELERRNPTGFLRWLAAHAQPDTDPTQHLRPAAELPTSQDGEP